MSVAMGWRIVRLGDVIVAKYGKALPEAKRKGGAVPVYGSNGVVGYHDAAITQGPTIVIGRKGSSGEVNFSPVPCWPIDTTFYIDDPGPYSIEFLDRLLRSLGLTEFDRSTAIPGLSREQLYDIEVPVPKPDEQRALVGILTSVERYGDTTAEHLTTSRRAINRFRQAVLVAACSGRLTGDWRNQNPNVHSVELDMVRQRRLLQLGHRFREPRPNSHAHIADLPESWGVGPLGLLLYEIKYGTSKRSEYGAPGTPVLRIPNVSGERLDIADLKSAILNVGEAESLRLRLGDLLMIRSNGSVQLVGKTLPVTEEAVGMAYAGYLMRLRTDEEVLDPEFLAVVLASPHLRRQIEMPARSTSGVNNINTDEVRGLMAPIPPLDEQREIVKRISETLSSANLLLARIEAASRRVGRSSQAVLAKAFRGELIPTDAEALAAPEKA